VRSNAERVTILDFAWSDKCTNTKQHIKIYYCSANFFTVEKLFRSLTSSVISSRKLNLISILECQNLVFTGKLKKKKLVKLFYIFTQHQFIQKRFC